MIQMKHIAALAAALSFCGCSSISGPPQIMTPNGVQVRKAPPTGTYEASPAAAFKEAAVAAYEQRQSYSGAGEMLESGFSLVRADCQQFFISRKEAQGRANILRSSVAPISAALAGIIGLVRFSDNDVDRYITALALGTAAINSSIDIHTEHYLFGAENVQEVRDLTFKAISASEQAIRTANPAGYYAVANQLMDHQDICTPRRIAQLARLAIAAGDVTAASLATIDTSDAKVLLGLGEHFGMPGSLNADQTGAVWWLLNGAGSDHYDTIGTKLLALGSKSPLVADASLNPPWRVNLPVADRDKVIAILDGLSAQTRSAFAQSARATEKDIKTANDPTSWPRSSRRPGPTQRPEPLRYRARKGRSASVSNSRTGMSRPQRAPVPLPAARQSHGLDLAHSDRFPSGSAAEAPARTAQTMALGVGSLRRG